MTNTFIFLNQSPKGKNNRARSDYLNKIAENIASREQIKPEAPPKSNYIYIIELMTRGKCHRETARKVWKRYLQRSINPNYQQNWGGIRKGAGRKPKNYKEI